MPRRRPPRVPTKPRDLLLLLGLLSLLGCGGQLPATATPSAAAAPVASPGIRGLRVRLAEEIAIVSEGNADSRYGDHLRMSLRSALDRAGLTVVSDRDQPADLTLRVDTRVAGALGFLRGQVQLVAERQGTLVACATADTEVHREGEFPALMAEKAVALLLAEPAIGELARRMAPPLGKPASSPADSAAPPAAAFAQAKSHASRATSFYNLGRYPEALAEYEAAYLAVADPPFLFNIAQCQRKVGHEREALASYRAYLREAPHAPNRTEVQHRISDLEREGRPAR